MDIFINWYNHQYRHTGIGHHTPADVHFGLATDKAADRRAVLTDVRAQHPHRFGTTRAPKILDLFAFLTIRAPCASMRIETCLYAELSTSQIWS